MWTIKILARADKRRKTKAFFIYLLLFFSLSGVAPVSASDFPPGGERGPLDMGTRTGKAIIARELDSGDLVIATPPSEKRPAQDSQPLLVVPEIRSGRPPSPRPPGARQGKQP